MITSPLAGGPHLVEILQRSNRSFRNGTLSRDSLAAAAERPAFFRR
jgi:hypothetical protein